MSARSINRRLRAAKAAAEAPVRPRVDVAFILRPARPYKDKRAKLRREAEQRDA